MCPPYAIVSLFFPTWLIYMVIMSQDNKYDPTIFLTYSFTYLFICNLVYGSIRVEVIAKEAILRRSCLC